MQNTKKIYFLSDLHLGAKYLDDTHTCERRVVRWLDSVKDSASEIYLLGDILDYWYEYRYVVPRGFVRFFGKLAELSDAGVKIHWFIGNHDIWIFDYLPTELGIDVIDGYEIKDILGKRFFLSHGDGVGQKKMSFRLIRAIFRNKFCQFLFSGIHPRWTIPFAHGWSHQSRASHSKNNNSGYTEDNYLKKFVKEYSALHDDVDYYVFGHIHVVRDEKLNNGSHFIILGDWIHYNSYAEFDGENMVIRYFEPHCDE